MSQSIVNEVLAKKPKRRVEWVQKRLKEDLAITHRDSLYEVLVRKEGRAFAADISGADAVRTYNAVLAAIELFTTKQQRHLQADTFLLRKIHSQEQERHKAAQAKAKAAAKKPAKDAPSASGLRPTVAKEAKDSKDPKMARGPRSPDPPLSSTTRRTSSPPFNSAVPSKERPRSESPDWIPRTPPQAPPQEPRKTTGSWTTIFQSPSREERPVTPSRNEAASTVERQGAKEMKESKGKSKDRDSSSSTEYNAFATGPEPIAMRSPSRKDKKQSEDVKTENAGPESSARPSGLLARSVKPASPASPSSGSSSSSERSSAGKQSEIAPKQHSHDGGIPSSSDKTRKHEHDEMMAAEPLQSEDTDAATGPGSNLAMSRKLQENPKVNDHNDHDVGAKTQECDGSGSDSDETSASVADDDIGSPGAASHKENKGLAEGSECNSESDSDPSVSVQSVEGELPLAEAASNPPEPPRRQPPPPPPPTRRRVAEVEALPRWRYIAPDGQERLAIRSSPGVDAPTTGGSLGSGEVFSVDQESPGTNGVIFLRLADGRGWVFDRKSGLARRRRARPLCVPYQVPLVDEDDLFKAHKRHRPENRHPKAKRRRRQVLIDPYMVTADIIQVDSEEDAPTKAAKTSSDTYCRAGAKESLRVQLEKKQQEVQALRAKLSQLDAQQGRRTGSQTLDMIPTADLKETTAACQWATAEAKNPNEKRRELQAMLAKKRAMSAAGLQKATPRYVD